MRKNKIMKRLLSVLTVAAFLSQTMLAFAATDKLPEKVLFFENFEGYGEKHYISMGEDAWTGGEFLTESAWAVNSRNFLGLIDDEQSKSKVLYLGVTPHNKDGADEGYIYKSVKIDDSVGIRFSFKYEEEKEVKRIGVMINNNLYNLFVVEDNILFDSNGRKLKKLSKSVWYDCAIVVNQNGYYNIYIDEKRVTGSGVKIKGISALGKDVSIYFGVNGIEERAPESVNNMQLDDIIIYNGNKVLTKNEIKNLPVQKRYEHFNQPNGMLDLEEKYKALDERTKNMVVYAVDNEKSYIKGEIKEAPIARWENDRFLIPVIYTLEAFDGISAVNGDTTVVKGSWGEISVTADGTILVNSQQPSVYTEVKDGIVFAEADDFAPLIGKVYSSVKSQLVGISSVEDAFKETELELSRDIINRLYFNTPTKEEILTAFNGVKAEHPRLLVNEADFERMRNLVKTDEIYAKWVDYLIKKSEETIETPYIKNYYDNASSLLSEARGLEKRLPMLSLAYHLSGNKALADRAIDEMMYVLSFPDWDVTHTLGMAAIGFGVSICYDWLYDLLTEEQRAQVERALYIRHFQPMLEVFRIPTTKWNLASHWVKDDSNWNSVCCSAAVLTSLAIFEKHPEEAAEVIASAYQSYGYVFCDFFPDGGYLEGLGYWDYCLRIFLPAMASANICLGTDFDYPETTGLEKTIDFPYYLHGINAFGFHDSRNTPINTYVAMYMAKRLNRPDWGKLRTQSIERGTFSPHYQDILYYDSAYSSYNDVELELDKYFRFAETGSIRSTWADRAGALVFFHGGEAKVGHSQMDSGSLEMEMLGERWIWDLGTDDLTYDTGAVKNRYDVYRLRAEGNNSLVINPSADGGQERDAFAFISDFETKERGSFAVMDITESYRDFVDSYKRGYMLADDRRSIVIQDEVNGKKPQRYFWSFNTKADMEIAEDGQSAILSLKDKKLKLTLKTDIPSAKITTMASVPLETSPQVANARNVGVRKIVIDVENVQSGTISLTFSPIDADKNAYVAPLVPMSEWEIPDGELVRGGMTNLTINNVVYDELTDTRFSYNVYCAPSEVDSLSFNYTLKDGYTATESRSGNKRYITLTDSEGRSQTYTFSINKRELKESDNVTMHKVIKAEATAVPEANHSPELVFDNNYENDSRWSSQGEQSLILDYGESKRMDYAGLVFYYGDVRISAFEVYTSDDKTNWTQVGKFESSGIAGEMDKFKLKSTNARYIKFDFNGTSVSEWNSIIEAAAYEINGKG